MHDLILPVVRGKLKLSNVSFTLVFLGRTDACRADFSGGQQPRGPDSRNRSHGTRPEWRAVKIVDA